MRDVHCVDDEFKCIQIIDGRGHAELDLNSVERLLGERSFNRSQMISHEFQTELALNFVGRFLGESSFSDSK